VLEFARAVQPLAAALDPIVRGEVGLVDPHIAAYFRDVYDHVLRAADQISGLDQLLSGALREPDPNPGPPERRHACHLRLGRDLCGQHRDRRDLWNELSAHAGVEMEIRISVVLTFMLAVSTVLYRGFKRSNWI
jgi:magnesium transporter